MQLAMPGLAWPALREELRLFEGPPDAAGHPTWTVQDPVRHRFVRIDWLTWEVLRRWWLGDAAAIAREISSHTTLSVDARDVAEVLALVRREELVHPQSAAAADERPAWRRALAWLLHNYLFFRVPLLRPDRWLAALLPWTRWLGGPAFLAATLVAAAAGLFGVLQQTERLHAQWLDVLSWRGLLLYGLTLSAVKFAHELGHALVARYHGCRVPTMGLAFMVMWPVAYTDTTEAWRLADRRARMQIAAAGVRTELAIAAWATLAWGLLPDGPARTAAFVLATMTWVSSLLINLSPFMRFDGYFLLCDVLELPNLHERSFAQARSWLRRVLLGWTHEPAEHFAPRVRGALVAFALATWGWRLALYLGIAWAVYSFGFKLLGIGLLCVELGWFVAAPVAREFKAWGEGWPQWRMQRRVKMTTGLLILLAGAAVLLPWRSGVTGAALVQPAHTLALRLPSSAVLESLDVRAGSPVKAGQPLLRAATAELARQEAGVQAQLVRLQQDVAAAAMGGDQQGQWHSLQAELATAREQAHALREARARLQPVAPFDGLVVDVLPGLRAGMPSPPPNQVLMHLASTDAWSATAYVDEATARSLQPGQPAWLGLDADPLRRWEARVQSIAPQPAGLVPEALLVQAHGGLIEARETSGGWVPSQALYRVTLVLDQQPALSPRSWRGHVTIEGPARTLAERVWRHLAAAWVREAGF